MADTRFPLQQQQMFKKIAMAQKIDQVDVEAAFKIVVEGIKTLIQNDDFIRIADFIDLKVKDRGATTVIHPSTGKRIKVAATKTIHIKACQALKETVKNDQ